MSSIGNAGLRFFQETSDGDESLLEKVSEHCAPLGRTKYVEHCNNPILGIGYESASNNLRAVDMTEICKENHKIVIKFIVRRCPVYVGTNLRSKLHFWMLHYNICNDARMWSRINLLTSSVL